MMDARPVPQTNNQFVSVFAEFQPDFFHYMLGEGGLARKTSRDYIWRLKFLSRYYLLDENLTEEYIEYILAEEDIRRLGRNVYSKRKALSDFRGGLRKFLAFIKSDYNKRIQESIIGQIKKIKRANNLSITEKEAILKARIGQGKFRRTLIDYWKGCSICGVDMTCLLVASHIKPWRVSNNVERLDVFNGLLLLPNYDKLFDLGYMSFLPNGKAIYSCLLEENDRKVLKLTDDLRLSYVERKHMSYLKYHNDNCFLQ